MIATKSQNLFIYISSLSRFTLHSHKLAILSHKITEFLYSIINYRSDNVILCSVKKSSLYRIISDKHEYTSSLD